MAQLAWYKTKNHKNQESADDDDDDVTVDPCTGTEFYRINGTGTNAQSIEYPCQ